ncbi:hypothetical protein BDN72DRAFT_392250 [Pluteus cervinus]|uniref:Uncharacterized protein n=1 Tax=Pluteus cervinus TaxID=181527 RepID=A0ACD3AAG5_9AGAR|nr:hypothetical protein BDN72DRAFT_392250 [Pluteus cervinus]
MSLSTTERVVPDELWEQVFLHLDYPSVLRCKQACRLFSGIITASAEIQYRGELTMDCMIDTGMSNLPITDRLTLLRKRRFAWDNLQWNVLPKKTIPAANTYHTYDFVAGTYALIGGDEFIAVTLPTTAHQGIQKTHTLDFRALDFVMDPTQDVVIFLGYQMTADPSSTYLYVRTYESMTPHPQSEQSRILVNSSSRSRVYQLHLNGDIFALANSHPTRDAEIRIWNWKTAKLIIELTVTNSRAESFAFLSSEAFAMVIRTDSGYISIYDVSSGTEISRLRFPELTYGSLSSAIVDTPPFLAQPRPDCVVATSPKHRIHTFMLTYASDESDYNLQAYILNEFLLSYATPPTAGQGSSIHIKDVRWEDWGPHNTRIVQVELFRNYPHYFSQGLRVVLPVKRSDWQLCILDFNIHRKLADRPEKPKAQVTTVAHPTTISNSELGFPLFKYDVETYLPYILHRRVIPDPFPVGLAIPILLSECHIAAVNDLDPDDSYIFSMEL